MPVFARYVRDQQRNGISVFFPRLVQLVCMHGTRAHCPYPTALRIIWGWLFTSKMPLCILLFYSYSTLAVINSLYLPVLIHFPIWDIGLCGVPHRAWREETRLVWVTGLGTK